MANSTSQHILNTAANLLGFCLVVITSLHVADKTEANVIDEITFAVALLLTCSCFFSFLSIRTVSPIEEKRLEKLADGFFLTSLIGILMVILLITFSLVS